VSRITELLGQRLEHANPALTSSGSAALILALRASGVPRGASVLMPAICCPAVLFAIQLAGYRCVLADTAPGGFNSEVEQFAEALTPDTRAIVGVHAYGIPLEIDRLEQFAMAHGLLLIEDACLALGGAYRGRPLGSFGDISIVSFGYDKPVPCEYGGALLTERADWRAEAERMIAENRFFAYESDPARDGRLIDGLQRLPEMAQERQENARLIESRLAGGRAGGRGPEKDIAYWRYPLLVRENRDSLVARARAAGLLLTTHYKSLAGLMTEAACPNAQHVSDHVINIFVRPGTDRRSILDRIEFLNEQAA